MSPVLLVASCTGGEAPPPPPPPTTAAPSPTRPVVDLRFDVAEDLLSVRGQERVRFTPDLRACELVFRAWPNKPATARTGNSLVVTAASIDGSDVTPRVTSAGAPPGAPGTLVELPLPRCVDAGTTLTADLSFDVSLAPGTDERMGTDPSREIAWFGTAFPLLAWERGRGWAEDPAVDIVGEMATSEDFRLASLKVVTPSGFEVMGTGEPVGSSPGTAGGTTEHDFSAEAVRDVTVTVGRLQISRHDVDGVKVLLGTAEGGTEASLDEWWHAVDQAVDHLSRLLGPLPYKTLWVSILPGVTSGVEFPGAIQLGDVHQVQQWLVSHEVAHQWFYALVGNNQAEHPWLDESFASFAQRLADGEASAEYDERPPDRFTGEVGEPIGYWAGFRRPNQAYVDGVYEAGAEALLEARRRSGSEAFDAALREYIRENAHSIAVPGDVRQAFHDFPGAMSTLEDAGALSPGT